MVKTANQIELTELDAYCIHIALCLLCLLFLYPSTFLVIELKKEARLSLGMYYVTIHKKTLIEVIVFVTCSILIQHTLYFHYEPWWLQIFLL